MTETQALSSGRLGKSKGTNSPAVRSGRQEPNAKHWLAEFTTGGLYSEAGGREEADWSSGGGRAVILVEGLPRKGRGVGDGPVEAGQ